MKGQVALNGLSFHWNSRTGYNRLSTRGATVHKYISPEHKTKKANEVNDSVND